MLLFVYLLFCLKELSAVTGQTIINDISCYNAEDKGTSYNGKINTTINGKTCLNWKKYDSIYALYYEDHNYCRNPLPKELDKPWCYTGEGLKNEYCNIPVCGCRASLHDLMYNGHISKTRNGTQCKAWTETKYTSEENNYCRTPDNDQDNDGGPWCYDNSLKIWNRCNVPVCHGKFCPDLSRYGLDTLDGKSKYQYGETAVVFCKRTSGSQTVLICQPNGKWNLPIPNCEDCRTSLNDVNYTGHINMTRHGYPCKAWAAASKYQLEENNYCRTPLGDGDNDGGPWCYIDVKNSYGWDICNVPVCGGAFCPALSSLRMKTLQGKYKYRYGETAIVSCRFGIQENKNIKCMEDGRWNETVQLCTDHNCASLYVSPHVKSSKQMPKYNENVTLSCEKGYHGDSISFKCYANGSWPIYRPNCKPVDCAHLTVSADVKPSKQMHKFNDNVVLSCKEGYLQNSISIKCYANGSWPTDRPNCKPATDCAPLILSPRFKPLNQRPKFNDNVTLSCMEGYLGSSITIKCYANGYWPTKRPDCKPINCAPLLVSPHVEPLKQSQRPKFNDNVTLSCVEGYIGSSITIKCYANGYWPTDRPNCEPGDCVSLDVGDHVKLSKQMPKFNDNVTLSCEKGYLGDSISIKCFANGSWPTDRPSCKPITCSMLTVDDQISKSENISRYNDNVTLSCKEGYIGAPVILKCNANGVWLSQRPNCTAITCIMLTVDDQVMKSEHITKYNDNDTLSCKEGYIAVLIILKNNASGDWPSQRPNCAKKSQSFEDSMEKRCTCMSYGLFGGTLAVVVAISAGIHIATCFYFRKRVEKSATVYEDMQFKTVERQKGSNEETYTELT